MKRINVMLDPESIEFHTRRGNGNLSKGIRMIHGDALEALKSLVQEHNKRAGKISCDDTCFCWDVESFISREQMRIDHEL